MCPYCAVHGSDEMLFDSLCHMAAGQTDLSSKNSILASRDSIPSSLDAILATQDGILANLDGILDNHFGQRLDFLLKVNATL